MEFMKILHINYFKTIKNHKIEIQISKKLYLKVHIPPTQLCKNNYAMIKSNEICERKMDCLDRFYRRYDVSATCGSIFSFIT